MSKIKPDKIARVAPAAVDFGKDLIAAFSEDSAGGKKITKREVRKLARKGLVLMLTLLRV